MILIDSNIWIFAENDKAPEQKQASEKIRKIIDTTEFGINPIITSEVFYKLNYILGKDEAHKRMINILDHRSAKWLDVPLSTARKAINLSFNSEIKINDAIIAQQAIDFNISLLTDNVKDFKRIKEINIITLRG